jgi:hypothetical protein
MNLSLRRLVKRRAQYRCEYCRIPLGTSLTPFQIDHVIARKHGGSSVAANLAFCCFHCNLNKGPNIAGIDPNTGRMISLFHPRRDRWREHFALRIDGHILGRTDIGRVTISVLNMNAPDAVALRGCLVAEGRMKIEVAR